MFEKGPSPSSPSALTWYPYCECEVRLNRITCPGRWLQTVIGSDTTSSRRHDSFSWTRRASVTPVYLTSSEGFLQPISAVPGKLWRRDLPSENERTCAMPVLLPVTCPAVQSSGGRSPQGGGKRRPAGTFQTRFSFPGTGYVCSPLAAVPLSGCCSPQALPSWDSFWLSFSRNRLCHIRRREE